MTWVVAAGSRRAVAGRAGQDHGPAVGRDRPGDPLADRDPLGRVALGEAVGGLADQGGAVGGEQQQAARLGPPGLDGRLQHHRQQLGQVVGRGEGLAEAVHGAGQLVAAGPQGAQVLAQLDPHALEGPGQLAELAAGADARRGAGEVAPGDRPGLVGQLAQGPADQPGQDRAEQGGHQADDHQPEQHDGQQARVDPGRRGGRGDADQQPRLLADLVGERLGRHRPPGGRPACRRRVPSAAGTRSSAVRRPMVLATGVSPMTRVRSASRVPLASRWSSWLSIQMPAVTVPSRQRRDPAGRQPRARRSALRRWSIGQLRTRCSGARIMPSGARRTPGRNPGLVWPARPSTRWSGAVTARSRSVGAWRRSTARTSGGVPGRHGLEQRRVAGQGGHGLMGPLDPGREGDRGRAAGQLQLGADLALGRPGDRLPAIGGDRGDRKHHDDDEEECEAGP